MFSTDRIGLEMELQKFEILDEFDSEDSLFTLDLCSLNPIGNVDCCKSCGG